MSTPKPMSNPTLTMISPKPPVIALIVSSKPTPAASPRYRQAMTREMTGSTFALMMSATTRTIAIAVCRATMAVSWSGSPLRCGRNPANLGDDSDTWAARQVSIWTNQRI